MLLLERAYGPHATEGHLTGLGLDLRTIELPWLGNEPFESCIPPGVYRAMLHDSPTHGECLWLRSVPGRTEILMHVANGPSELDGCIAPGLTPGIRCDPKEPVVWSSAAALQQILDAVATEGGEVDIDIRTYRPEWP